jgi:hypothetical protein
MKLSHGMSWCLAIGLSAAVLWIGRVSMTTSRAQRTPHTAPFTSPDRESTNGRDAELRKILQEVSELTKGIDIPEPVIGHGIEGDKARKGRIAPSKLDRNLRGD